MRYVWIAALLAGAYFFWRFILSNGADKNSLQPGGEIFKENLSIEALPVNVTKRVTYSGLDYPPGLTGMA